MLIRLIDTQVFAQGLRDIHRKLGVADADTVLIFNSDGALKLLRKSPNASLGVSETPLAGYSFVNDSWVPNVVAG